MPNKKISAQAAQLSDSVLEKKDAMYKGTKSPGYHGFHRTETKEKVTGEPPFIQPFCPGAGQVYNKKYWKVPIVYAAIGIPAYLYFYNKKLL